jgi:hypothetical protein
MASDNMKHRRLQELGESDFEIVDGQPDIRGWDVKNEQGKTIGEVEELILDARERKVRYMVVDLDNEVVKRNDDDKVLIPIGLAELHEKDDDVLIPHISLDQLRSLPAYDEDSLDDETEQSISRVLGRTSAGNGEGISNFYEHTHFDDQKLYSRRLLPEHTSGEQQLGQNGIQLNQRMLSEAESRETDTEDSNGSAISFQEETIQEDHLMPVHNERRDTDIDQISDRNEERTESPVERDIERRNREGRTEDGRSAMDY